jgi:anti-sigma B factor antagonist
MPLQVRQREVENILILDLNGRIVAGAEASDLRNTVSALRERGTVNAVLNLKQVHYLDSTGLGALVVAHAAFRKAGGAMKLLHVSKRIAELMIITKLSTVFEIYDDEQAAIDSFFADREVHHFDILEFVQSQEREPQHLGADEPGSEPKSAET